MAILNVNSASFGDLSVSGSTILSGSSSRTLQVRGSGSAIFTISGSGGGLFEIGDSTSADMFTVTSASINLLTVSSTNTTITGSLRVSGTVTSNSFIGTASYASNAISSSYALTASYALTSGGGGGGGTPGGSTGDLQYNAGGGSFGGVTNVEHENGNLRFNNTGSVPNPATSGSNLYGLAVGGRSMLAVIGPSGLSSTIQPHIGRNKIALWQPAGNSTTITAIGSAALTATGTATAANVATTNRYTYQRRLEYLVTTAATTAVAGFRGAVAYNTIGGPSAGDGGFHFVCGWGPSTGVATATSRCFVGMGNSVAAPTDVEPSTITNIVGVGWDAADTNIQFMYRGTGTIAKIDLGASFPVPTVNNTSAYELILFSPAGTVQSVSYELNNLGTGAKAVGTVTTNLPTATTFLAPRGWMSVGGTSSVIGIGLMGLYIESDY